MKLLVALLLIIVFISTFFTLYIFNWLMRAAVECLIGQNVAMALAACNVREYGVNFLVGVTIVSFFILLAVLALFVVVKNLLCVMEIGGHY